MICRECGAELAKRERFCPQCGSYFIDKDSGDTGIWRGVITDGGILYADAHVVSDPSNKNRINNNSGKIAKEAKAADRKKAGWGIAAIILFSFTLLFNILEILEHEGTVLLGILPFFAGMFSTIKAFGTRKSKIALALLVADLISLFTYIMV